ncbi:hemagglutinin protein [Winogradskyella sp.]|uniref:hemagglutinin protein n=1 Tax=Winogradskyella sp. TaxID=1883156 RepID=UPI001B107F1E|nr:hemagglutinin protein [Winogradskyella sp.]MBO6880935.1 hemagglutinin protein [Winogradskyella sp.]
MKILSVIILIFTITFCPAQSIERFSIDNGGASVSNGSIQLLYTIGEVNVQEIDAGSVSVSEGFITSGFKILVDPKVFLQGPLINAATPDIMEDDLRTNDQLPTTSPYEDNATCNTTVFDITGNNAIVDWVWLELRDANDNTKIVNARSALLQRDGDVVDVDGVSNITMQAPPTGYYVTVKHRNHLGVMSAQTIMLNESSATDVDFTDNAFNTFGTNAQVLLASGSTALWAGDTNNDGSVQFSGGNSDVNILKDFILNHPSNPLGFLTVAINGYFNQDVNMDGIAKFSGTSNDSNAIKDIILNHPGNFLNIPTFTINTQVPEN